MYKLVVSDFDKTLIDDDLSIPISTVIAIDKIRRKKIKFVVATGRELSFVKYYIKDVNFIDYIVALNGSYIYDVEKEKVVYDKSLKISDIKKIINKYRTLPVKIYLYTDNSRCYLNETQEITKEIVIRDLNDFLKNNKVYKIEIHTKTTKLREEIKEELDNVDLSISSNIEEYDNKDYLVEIVYKDINKYVGLKKVLSKEKILDKDVVAFGDSYNDMPIFENVGLPIAVSNAIKEIKDISKKKTLSNNDRGLEKSIVELFEIK